MKTKMNIKKETIGQTSTELILIIAAISIIVLITAQYTTTLTQEITNHTQEVIDKARDNIIGKL